MKLAPLSLSEPLVLAGAVVLATAGCGGSSVPPTQTLPVQHGGIHKIQHVVVIMQENRSFDSYFGTYPGADGIPGLAGNPGTVPCLPDPRGEDVRAAVSTTRTTATPAGRTARSSRITTSTAGR